MEDALFSNFWRYGAQQVSFRMDEVSRLNKQLFDNVIFEKYMHWDEPTVSKYFEEALGQYRITIAAATIGDDSMEPIVGREGFEYMKEKVLTHALTVPMRAAEWRKILEIRDSVRATDQQKKDALVNSMFNNAKDAVEGVLARLDIIFLTALSNLGKFQYTDENNPEGGVKGLIDYQQPNENIATANTPWTNENIATVDPFEDIIMMMEAAKDKIQPAKMLLAPAKLYFLLRSKKLKQVIFGKDKNDSPLLPAELNNFLASNELPTIEVIRRRVRIQNHNHYDIINPWNDDNIVFIPDGELGVVKNSYTDDELMQEEDVQYSNYDRIRLTQWKKGIKDNSKINLFAKAESVSLPVITEMKGVYTLQTGAQ